jgi:hypothetical protein
VKDALGNVFNGNEDEAAEKRVNALLAVGTPAAPTPQFDVQQVAQTVKSELERERALGEFAAKYPRIMNDPDLPEIADRVLARVLQTEPQLPFAVALERVGADLYQRFGFEAKRASEANDRPTTNRTQEVTTRKAGLDIPAGRMVSAATAAEPPESSEAIRSQTIAEIAAARRPQQIPARMPRVAGRR